MRYFLVLFEITVLAVMGIAGRRLDDGGGTTRKPPIYVFPDMDRQLKLRPQEPNAFFPNGVSSQLPPPGTIARSEPLRVGDEAFYRYQDVPVFTGFVSGTTNFVEHNPIPVTAQVMQRGQERYAIHCAPCHGAVGDGNGITRKIGAMPVVGNLHEKRIVSMADGELFYVITHGRNLMGAYWPNIPPEDRWAIIWYVRALQRSRLGTLDDVPQELRASLNP